MPDLDPTAVIVAALGVVGAWLGGGWLVSRNQKPERILSAAQAQSAWMVEQMQEEYQTLRAEMAAMRVDLADARTELADARLEVATLRIELSDRDARIAELVRRLGDAN